MNKKEWLDYLYYEVGKQNQDFFLCGLKKIENGEVLSTKWKKYSEVCFPLNPKEDNQIEWVNQRQILSNEIVLDLEDKEKIKEVIEKLKILEIKNYYVWETGSRGFHIHIFDNISFSEKTKKYFSNKIGADLMKSGTKTMIALENVPHWKTGKIKKLVKNGSQN